MEEGRSAVKILICTPTGMGRIFRPKRDENGEWRRLHNEELHGLHRSPRIVSVIKYRRLRWGAHVVRMVEGRSAFKMLTGKLTRKIHLGWPRRRWEDNIRMDLEEIGISSGNWVDSAQDTDYWKVLVNAGFISYEVS